jgi:hypothetical protein
MDIPGSVKESRVAPDDFRDSFCGCCSPCRGRDFTLPHDYHPPPQRLECMDGAGISTSILIEFLNPEIGIRPRCGRNLASFMPMPKAPMHEQGAVVARKYKVWLAREALCMKSITHAQRMYRLSKHQLWHSILATNKCHASGAFRRGKGVYHFAVPECGIENY